MHPHIDAFLSKLKRVSRTRTGWEACCPAHDDHDPSMSVSIGTSGGIVVCCHARHCTAESIATAVGMRLLDFAPDPPAERNGHAPELSWDERIVTTYDYRNAAGELVYQVARLHTPKDFRQRRVSGAALGPAGERLPVFAWNMRNTKRVPYRLPELVASSGWIVVVEGEKDADNLAAAGLTATTNAGGAGKWGTLDPEAASVFASRRVAIVPDNDAPGLRHAIDVADDLVHRGAACVRVVLLPGLAAKGDVSDWLAAGGSAEQLMTMIQLAPDWPSLRGTLVAAAEELDRRREAAKVKPSSRNDDIEIHLTDVGNSLRFARQHRDDARYCQPWGAWLIWTGTHWEIDSRNSAVSLAKKTVRTIMAEARGQLGAADAVLQQRESSAAGETGRRQADIVVSSTTNAKALSLHAFRSEASPRIQAMLRLAQSELPVVPDELDRDNYLFNCLNGTLNLRTGEFRDHCRDDHLTRVAPVHYDPEAKCPQWERTLRSVFPEHPLHDDAQGDGEMIAFIARFFGLCLTGDTTSQAMTILHGEGSNGKSTLLETVCAVLGPYAGPSPKGLLEIRRGEQHPTELAKLFGKRLVHATETSEGARLDEAQVKALTGGDTILARRMREDFWEFSPTHKLVICTNHKPKIKGTDYAIWRRVLLVPFASRFWNPDEPAKSGELRLERFRKKPELIGGKFRSEWSGILNWLVRGFKDWQTGGLRPPERVQVATAEYQRSEDPVGQFIAERCRIWTDRAVKTKSGDLFAAFLRWCEDTGERAVNRRVFAHRIIAATGFEPLKSTGRWLPGVDLLPEEDSESEENDVSIPELDK